MIGLAGILLFVLTLVLVHIVCGIYENVKKRIRVHYTREAHRDIAASIESAAHWFCEDARTNTLLNGVARQIQHYGTVQADALRNEWRKVKQS